MVIPTQESREIDIALLEVSHGSKAALERFTSINMHYTHIILYYVRESLECHVTLT